MIIPLEIFDDVDCLPASSGEIWISSTMELDESSCGAEGSTRSSGCIVASCSCTAEKFLKMSSRQCFSVSVILSGKISPTDAPEKELNVAYPGNASNN